MTLARDFFEHWCDVINARNEEVDEKWCNYKEYTNLIIHADNSILVDVAKNLDFHCYNGDYYCLDALLYHEDDCIEGFGGCYLKDIRVAFEHENKFRSGLYQETSHLLLINCDLRVIVSYPPSELAERKELEYLHGIISSSRCSKALSDSEGFLFIMGHEKPYSWKGWIYKLNSWHEIANISMENFREAVI